MRCFQDSSLYRKTVSSGIRIKPKDVKQCVPINRLGVCEPIAFAGLPLIFPFIIFAYTCVLEHFQIRLLNSLLVKLIFYWYILISRTSGVRGWGSREVGSVGRGGSWHSTSSHVHCNVL